MDYYLDIPSHDHSDYTNGFVFLEILRSLVNVGGQHMRENFHNWQHLNFQHVALEMLYLRPPAGSIVG